MFKLTKPSQAVFLVSLALAFIGLLVFAGAIGVSISAFWWVAAAYVLLLLGVLVRNL